MDELAGEVLFSTALKPKYKMSAPTVANFLAIEIVRCPQCLAPQGCGCVSDEGRVWLSTTHYVRRLMLGEFRQREPERYKLLRNMLRELSPEQYRFGMLQSADGPKALGDSKAEKSGGKKKVS